MYRILCAILVAIIITYAFNHDSHNTKPVAPTKVEIIFTGKTPAYMAPVHAFDQEQLECLAKNIYFEARGESVQGQVDGTPRASCHKFHRTRPFANERSAFRYEETSRRSL